MATQLAPYGTGSSSCLTGCACQPSPISVTQEPVMDASEAALQKKRELDAMLAQAVSQLSFKERQMDMEELHGVPMEQHEVNTEACLLDLEVHLIKLKAGTAFETAEQINASFVNDRAMRLRFLRGNLYDTKTTAKKMIKFFELKRKLFGNEKLASNITQNDLTEDDMACLTNGSFQMLPEDRSKRLILLNFPCFRTYRTLQNELRARFYFYSKLCQMPAMEERGLVVVTYACEDFGDNVNGAGFKENTEMGVLFPIHYAGMHYATSSVAESLLSSAALAVIPLRWRSRFKFHFGSHMEVQYLLSTFGIPRYILPLSANNTAILDGHLECLAQFRKEEEGFGNNSADATSFMGNPWNVLFGRNKYNHSGNAALRQMVDGLLVQYEAASKAEKIDMSAQVVAKINGLGGRFLKEGTNGTWEVTSEVESREKVAQAFRNSRRSRSKQCSDQRGETNDFGALGEEIESPGPNDVLFGLKQQSTAGNARMRQLVRDMAKEYDTAATNEQKKDISEYVVQIIKEEGGRFLKRKHNGRFEEVSDTFARSRVSKRFCNSRRSQK